MRLGEVKKKAGFLEKEGELIEFWLQPNGLHPIHYAPGPILGAHYIGLGRRFVRLDGRDQRPIPLEHKNAALWSQPFPVIAHPTGQLGNHIK
jgi:hypothetical protein